MYVNVKKNLFAQPTTEDFLICILFNVIQVGLTRYTTHYLQRNRYIQHYLLLSLQPITIFSVCIIISILVFID